MKNPTVAAISTPRGKGGIAVIRISGSDAAEVAGRVFRPRSGLPLQMREAGKMTRGDILDTSTGELVDDGMAVIYRAPRSYTGEDSAEIFCHGGLLLAQTVLASVFTAGALPAGPGEFTRRAFTAGKLSLSSAEAVISLIDAENRAQLRLAASAVKGELSTKISQLCDELTALTASLYAEIDFPDEDLASLSGEEIVSRTEAVASSLAALRDTYRVGHAVAEGVPTVLCGLPNTGKSSLLNRILGRDRAIVTALPGTTRDILTETASFGGATLRLIDTAGLRESADEAESIGVRRAREAMEGAELIFALFDSSVTTVCDPVARSGEKELLDALRDLRGHGTAVIPLMTKCDLPSARTEEEKAAIIAAAGDPIVISTVRGDGMTALENKVKELFFEGLPDNGGGAVVANARQHSAVAAAAEAASRAAAAAASGATADMVGIDLEAALAALAECDGRAVSERVVADIFSRFCVGK